MVSGVELYSYFGCPYSQRSRMVLIEKNVAFTVKEVDLPSGTPDWFREISPYGFVPVLAHKGRHIFESAIINEYLEEAFPEPRLMPLDPGERAEARRWIHYCDSYFAPAAFGLHAKDMASAAARHQKFIDRIRYIENEALTRHAGPFFLGSSLSLVDLQFAPFLERLPAYQDVIQVDLLGECPRLAALLDVLKTTKSWQEAAQDADYHIARLRQRMGSQ